MPIMTVLRFLLIVWMILASLSEGIQAPAATFETDHEIQLIEGLRERRLFALASEHCRQLLESPDLAEPARVPLTLEWIRTCFAQAQHSPREERVAAWHQARRVAADFARNHPDHPQGLLVRVQDALTVLAWAEMHRQESEVLADPETALETARNALREARLLLAERQHELSELIPLRHRQPAGPGELNADRLISLQHQLHFQLARAYRNRALCYPPNSEDRVAALTSSIEQLTRPLQQIAASDPLIGSFRLELAISYRLLGQGDKAHPLLEWILDSDAASELRSRARAEAARIELDRERPQQAMRRLEEGRSQKDIPDPELDHAHLETVLALAHQAADRAEAARWREQASRLVDGMHQTHGPYWGRRGDLLLLRLLGPTSTAADMELLARTADELYRQGQLAEAVQAYDQAARAARAAEAPDRAFTWAYRAAWVLQTDQHHPEARKRLQELALATPDHPQAAAAHLLAAWNAAQVARDDPAKRAAYAAVLAEHVRKWPAGETADTARRWQGQLWESQHAWQAAAESYLRVSPHSDQYEASLQAAVRCWNRALDATAADGEAGEQLRAEAIAVLNEHLPGSTDGTAREWTPAARIAARQIAIWQLASVPAGHAEAQRVLELALQGAPPPDPIWLEQARMLQIAALAGQPDQHIAARQLWELLEEPSPANLLMLVRHMYPLTEKDDAELSEPVIQLLLDATARLETQAESWDGAERRFVRRIRAAALLAAGADQEARAAYEQLARDDPNDGRVQRAYAQLLLAAEDPESWQQALELWRTIAARSPPRTEAWYAARWGVSAALIQLGQEQEAARRIRYLQAIPPGLAGSGWEARFQELLDRCGATEPKE